MLLFYCNISVTTGGHWFLSFAFPVMGFWAILVTAVVALLRYVRKGTLYIFGGALLTASAFMPVMELLMNLTFQLRKRLLWSYYPLIVLGLLGGLLIFLAIYRPARETVERKFFL